MGVFYPPHIVLYGHFAPRRPMLSAWFSTRCGEGWAFLGSPEDGYLQGGVGPGGVFLVDVWVLPHPPGPPVGLHDRLWMPWAWGLAWCPRAGHGTIRFAPLLLSLVLVLQILPGHFQLAFKTQVVIGLMVLWTILGDGEGCWPPGFEVQGRGSAPIRCLEGRDGRPGRGRDLPPGGDPALADGPARGTLGRPPGLRIPLRFCGHALPSGQLCRAGTLPPFAQLAVGRLGPLSRHAGGEPHLHRVGPALPGLHGDRCASFAGIRPSAC